jgi:hypothetical protein
MGLRHTETPEANVFFFYFSSLFPVSPLSSRKPYYKRLNVLKDGS